MSRVYLVSTLRRQGLQQKVSTLYNIVLEAGYIIPVAISKALEVFIDRIIDSSRPLPRKVARGGHAKSPGAHFKAVITHQGQYDFLEGLTAEIAMPPE